MTVLFPKYVIAPRNFKEEKIHMSKFKEAGLPGCIGSMDATHVSMDQCSHQLNQANSGPKLDMLAQSYNIITNHHHMILSSTEGHP